MEAALKSVAGVERVEVDYNAKTVRCGVKQGTDVRALTSLKHSKYKFSQAK